MGAETDSVKGQSPTVYRTSSRMSLYNRLSLSLPKCRRDIFQPKPPPVSVPRSGFEIAVCCNPNVKMPEATDRLPGRGPRGSVLGFGNGTELYLTERPRNGNRVRFDRSASDNNENAAPQRSRSRLQGPSSGSPLPRWYPRTPLRDITAIINAIELRRERDRAIAESRRRNRLLSPRTPLLLSSPSSQEPSSFDQSPPPTHASPSIVSDFSSHFTTEPQKEVSTPVSTSASAKLDGKKFSDWEELERILMENLEKKMKEVEVKKKPEKSRLMSMR